MKPTVLLAVLAPILLASAAVVQELFRVQPDKENVVASRIEGRWVTDQDLTERLDGSLPWRELVFESDPGVVARIPEKYVEPLKAFQIFLAGHLAARRADGTIQRFPFILLSIHGNPHVLYFRERDDDPFGDSESFNVMLARGSERENDLLFVGGDFNNQPFGALQRGE